MCHKYRFEQKGDFTPFEPFQDPPQGAQRGPKKINLHNRIQKLKTDYMSCVISMNLHKVVISPLLNPPQGSPGGVEKFFNYFFQTRPT
jgi:hypothetical protein